MKLSIPMLFALTVLVSCADRTAVTLKPENLKQETSITIENNNLKVVFVDNEALGSRHRAGYNGIAELYHRYQNTSIFVPEYAGFNLEHVFGGDSLVQLFEPRRHPMKLYRRGEKEIVLHQEATPLSGVESLTTFQVNGPDYIDIVFECIFHNDEFFRHGYAGLFWASYIHKPNDKKIYFKGNGEGQQQTTWVATYSEKHGLNSTHRSRKDNHKFFFANNFNASLASHFSTYRYSDPYYYGRFGNMVLAFLFDSKEIIRFSQSPTGGGRDSPAWDFQYLIPSPNIGKKYSFRARMVYKPFVSEMDITREYEQWKASN
jgi:hypothetical protein